MFSNGQELIKKGENEDAQRVFSKNFKKYQNPGINLVIYKWSAHTQSHIYEPVRVQL